MRTMDDKSPLRRFLKADDVRVTAVARDLGIHRTTLWRWAEDGVPLTKVIAVEKLTGIPRAELRPDFFAPPPAPQHNRPAA